MRHQIVEAATANGAVVLRVRASPLPAAAASALDSAADLLSVSLLSRSDPSPVPAAAAGARQAEPLPAPDSANGTSSSKHAAGPGASPSAGSARQAASCSDAALADGSVASGHVVDGDAQSAATGGAVAEHSTQSAGIPPETPGQGGARGRVADSETRGEAADSQAASPSPGSPAAPSALAKLRARLTAAYEGGTGGEAAGGQGVGSEPGSALLRRAWQLGPRRVGPNVLLLPPRAGAPGLWDVPATAVLASGKRAGGAQGGPAAGPAGADVGVSGGTSSHAAGKTGGESAPSEQVRARHRSLTSSICAFCVSNPPRTSLHKDIALHCPALAMHLLRYQQALSGYHQLFLDFMGRPINAHQHCVATQEAARMVPINVGSPEAAALLGFCGSQPGAATPAAASNGGCCGQQRAQPGGADRAAALEQLRHGVEAGLAAGFQLAAAAGPLCDEPLWGVALEVCMLLQVAFCCKRSIR